MPIAEDLRHRFKGSVEAFHQFPFDEESKNLFAFYTPWGLYRYETLVMGVPTASSKCQEKTRILLEGLDGVQQIQDDVVIHGAGKQRDQRLQAVLERLQTTEMTLRKEKCHFGVSEMLWFGNTFSKQGMSPDPVASQPHQQGPHPG